MALRKKTLTKEPLRIRSHTLTPSTEAVLKRLSQTATDVIGRGVSSSAVVRAMLRYMNQQPFSWVREHLYPHIEDEMEEGRTWGRTKSS